MEGKGWMDGGKKKDGYEQDERKGKGWMKGEKMMHGKGRGGWKRNKRCKEYRRMEEGE